MPEVRGLSRAFVESHAVEAARTLEALSPGDSARFLASLAPELAALALRHMAPPYCAKVFAMLGDAEATGLFRSVGPQVAAQIIQQFPPDRQVQLLALMPVGVAVAIRLLIGYPSGTCGACMNPWPLALTPGTPAGAALDQVRGFEGDLGDCLFVTDDQRRLLGVVALDALLRADTVSTLSAVMSAPHHVLSALSTVTAVAGHRGWDDFHVLPVVERERRLVGAIHRHALVAMLGERPAGSAPDVAVGVAGAYWQTVSVLAQTVVGGLPPAAPVEEAGRNNER